MRKRCGFHYLVRLAVLAGIALSVTGCASYECRPMGELTNDQWEAFASDSGVAVRAKRYSDFEDPSYPFGKDMNREGFLPVRVMITNEGRGLRVIQAGQMVLSDATDQFTPVTLDVVHKALAFSPTQRYFGWAFGITIPTLGIGVIPGIIVGIVDGNNAIRANKVMRKDFADKRLKSQVLAAGQSVDGIAFFGIPRSRHCESLGLAIEVLDANDLATSVQLVLPALPQ